MGENVGPVAVCQGHISSEQVVLLLGLLSVGLLYKCRQADRNIGYVFRFTSLIVRSHFFICVHPCNWYFLVTEKWSRAEIAYALNQLRYHLEFRLILLAT